MSLPSLHQVDSLVEISLTGVTTQILVSDNGNKGTEGAVGVLSQSRWAEGTSAGKEPLGPHSQHLHLMACLPLTWPPGGSHRTVLGLPEEFCLDWVLLTHALF